MNRVAILHGAGYVGRALIEQVLQHPEMELVCVTSRSHARKPLYSAHPRVRGQVDISFSPVLDTDVDLVFVAAAHSQGAAAVGALRDAGFGGLIVDMSADFRLSDASAYEAPHPRPELLEGAWYGLPEITGPPPPGTKLIANPGCFASAVSLALFPMSRAGLTKHVAVTALTGASGSGALPGAATHFPSRSGNVRAYKVFEHQHESEIDMMVPGISYSFVPASGPWTHGIWGTAQVAGVSFDAGDVYERAYGSSPLLRLWPGELPELLWSVGSPFTDIGWVQDEGLLVVGFAIDNLMKGAATQAIQNVNLVLGYNETLGLLLRTTKQDNAL